MKQRCLNDRCAAFRNYGSRGISVCAEWMDFEPFLFWSLANGYQKGLDLDRIDNNGGYSPENCRWTDRKKNANNRRTTLMLTVDGKSLCRTEWEKRLSLPPGILKAWCETHGKEYAEERMAGIIENGYREKDFGYSHRKNVKHIESGMIFRSVREAAEHFTMAPCTISNAIRCGRSTLKGRFNYEVLEEREE